MRCTCHLNPSAKRECMSFIYCLHQMHDLYHLMNGQYLLVITQLGSAEKEGSAVASVASGEKKKR